MSMPAKKMPAKSAQIKSARNASVAGGKMAHTKVVRKSGRLNLRSGEQSKLVSRMSAQTVLAPSAKSEPATRKVEHATEPEDDAFDRAIADALKAGLLDDMIADALQAQRDGKTTPL